MAKNAKQTEKSKYPSRYSPGGYVTAAQYILELVCEKQASRQRIELPIKFWNLPEWRNTFVKQLRMVHKLLKKYSEKAIIRAINKNNIYSLFASWLEAKIQQEQRLLDVESTKENISDAIVRPTTIVFQRESRPIKNKLSKLMELDNG
jgi:hypothetical protein